MANPRQRLQEAAKGLSRAAERVDDLAIEAGCGTVSNGQGELGRQLITEGIKEVRKYADQIEEIVK